MLCILRRAQHGGGTPVGDHRGELVWVPPSSAARGAADTLLRQRRREILPQLLETDKNVWATHVLWGMQMTKCMSRFALHCRSQSYGLSQKRNINMDTIYY